ncbi:MAG: AIR synthase related protein, partial [Gemmatimonadales bacterium]|nr:AIR synthase related protein [Gemmatimonadales bacterium]
ASALSDLAATAAEPAGITIALTIPDGTADGDVVQVMRGVGAAAAAAGCQLLGGDMSGGGDVVTGGHRVRSRGPAAVAPGCPSG